MACIGKNLEQALNKQINTELFSSYLYKAMEMYFQSVNLKGFAGWMKSQSAEEYGHAMKLIDFVNERNGRVILTQVGAPDSEWKNPLAVFENVYAHELKVTKMIDELVSLASKEGDYSTSNMLQWFINEQVEEEASAYEIVEKLKLIKDAPQALFMMDSVLGQRK
jgi:ferritin